MIKTLSVKQELTQKRGESKNKSTSRPTVPGCGTRGRKLEETFLHNHMPPPGPAKGELLSPPTYSKWQTVALGTQRESQKANAKQGSLRAPSPGASACFQFLYKQCWVSFSCLMNNRVTSKDLGHFHHHAHQKLIYS